MKRFFSIIAVCILTLCAATSCIDEEKAVELTPQCVISSFSVANIQSPMTVKLADGTDTTYTVTMLGSDIKFNIDQLSNRIYTVDSLPHWLKIDRIVPSVLARGYVYVRHGGSENFVYFNTGKDSIDFTQTVEFKVVAMDGTNSRTYAAVINKATNDRDSLYWTQTTTEAPIASNLRAVVRGERVYVFAQTDDVRTMVSTTADGDGTEWDAPERIAAAVDVATVTVFGTTFYALGADGMLYVSTDAIDWNPQGDRVFARLLGADGHYLYAADETGIVGSKDGTTWVNCGGTADMAMLPDAPVSMVSYDTRTNASLQNVVMMGLSQGNADNAVVWYKISSEKEQDNQPWNYVEITPDNGFGMPRLEGVQMLRYNGNLLAFGAPYDKMYRSYDNGVTWHTALTHLTLPAEFVGTDGEAEGEDDEAETDEPAATAEDGEGEDCMVAPVVSVVAGEKIWLIQEGGAVWQGTISKALTSE